MQEGRTPRFPPRIRRFGRAPSLGKMSAYSANFNSSGSQTFCKLEAIQAAKAAAKGKETGANAER